MNEKFKSLESDFRSRLPAQSIIGIRLDGKSFHTFTKQYNRPFDEGFMNTMDQTAISLMNNLITGAMFGYVQSDEITIFFTDKWGPKNQFLFDGKIEKILSTSASLATGAFLKSEPNCQGIPVFDARIFRLQDLEEVQEYMDWRRLDARKNAITMAAESLFSHKELLNVSTSKRTELLIGTEFEKLPETFFNGRLIVRKPFEQTVEYLNKKNGEIEKVEVVRNKMVSVAALRDTTESTVSSFKEILAN